MRNRAKCALCSTIIESKAPNHFVACECKEIAIDGGDQAFKTYAGDFKNFIRLDDAHNEIAVKFLEKAVEEVIKPLSKDDMMKELDMMCEECESLPEQAMSSFVSQYDFYRLVLLMRSILRSD